MDSTLADTVASKEETFAEKNAKHFDKVAPGQWPQWVIDVHRQIAAFLTSPEFPTWIGILPGNEGGRMMDYACGDGLISRALKPLFSSIVGVDVSSSMLEKYRARASCLGLGPQDMIGVRGDLIAGEGQPTDPPLDEEDLRNFDLIAISMALHHVENPQLAMQKLAARLKVGGKLFVLDWAPLDGSTPAQKEYQEEVRKNNDEERLKQLRDTHTARHTISKPEGFTEQEMRNMFEQAECGDVKWKLADELSPIPVIEAKAQLYWASATKAVALYPESIPAVAE